MPLGERNVSEMTWQQVPRREVESIGKPKENI